jgi:hypothetical protein
MKSHHTIRAEAAETEIAVQEAPMVGKLVLASAGLGALIWGVLLTVGPAPFGAWVLAFPAVSVVCAALVWIILSLTKRTEARRQSVTAACLMFILAIIFFVIDRGAGFLFSAFFAVMLFGWGSRLKQPWLKWAALPYLAVAAGLRFLDIPGEGVILLVLGVATIAWALLANRTK